MVFYFHTKIAVISFLLFLYCPVVLASTLIVDSPFGKIQGKFISRDNNDKHHIVFRNIPYAIPPIGDLRFAKPQPYPKIDGIFDATGDVSVMCLAIVLKMNGIYQGSEDCLILNIFAKNINRGNKLKKVIIYIHGGWFVFGGSVGHDMGSFVATQDVIAVTINYRLNIFGFLSTGDDASPGNFGLWDQTMALQWVKDNIKAFGGDPSDITFSGLSAGAVSVAYLSLSPMTKGLFSKANSQSGSATAVFGEAIDYRKNTLRFAKTVGCWVGDITDKLKPRQSRDLIKCLRRVDASEITSYTAPTFRSHHFVPTVDGEFIPRKPFLLLQDESYLNSVGFYDRFYLLSNSNGELPIMITYYTLIKGVIPDRTHMTVEQKNDSILGYNTVMRNNYINSRLKTNTPSISVLQNIKDFYDRRNVGDYNLFDMITDLNVLIPAYDFLNAASRHKKCKAWFLYFDYFPAFMKGKYRGTLHAVDLLYWQDIQMEVLESILHYGMQGQMDDGDIQLKALYACVIAEFTKNGDPGAALKDLLPSGWPVYDPDSSYYLSFNLEPSVGSHLERAKRDFWLKKIPEWTNTTHERVF